MATYDEAMQAVLDEFLRVRDAGINPGSRATAYLKLAEAYARLSRPDQPHGATGGSSD